MTRKKTVAIQEGMRNYLTRNKVTPKMLMDTMGICKGRANRILRPDSLPDMCDVVFMCYTFGIDMETLDNKQEGAA